jgi:hypothetical protein
MSCLDTLPPTAAQGVVISRNIRDADRAARAMPSFLKRDGAPYQS